MFGLVCIALAIAEYWRVKANGGYPLLDKYKRSIWLPTSDGDRNPFHAHGKIKHAAVKWKSIVYVGRQHAACLLTMVDCGLPKEETQQAMMHGCGFVTEDGEFVDRHEAYRIAMENNQIVEKHGAPGVPVLYSEDLFERKLA